jgi:hypothetical protein
MSRKQHLALQCHLHNMSGKDGHVVWFFGTDGTVAAIGGTNTGGLSSREMRRAAARSQKKMARGKK